MNIISDDKPLLIFYYGDAKKDKSKNLRLTSTTTNKEDGGQAITSEAETEYYLIALQMPAKYFVFYAMTKEKAIDDMFLQDWIDKINDSKIEILGVGIEERLCYNDDHLVFITSGANLVFKNKKTKTKK